MTSLRESSREEGDFVPDRKVLIADDDHTTLKLLERTLEKAGFQPVCVSNGTEAVDRLAEDICAVILDIEMPGMNGLECLKYISREYPDLAPVMLTASDRVSDAVYAMKHGAFDYIVKPFKPQQITALVENAARSFEQAVRLRLTEKRLREARQNELYLASRIQQRLLLGRPPDDFPGLEIAHLSVPSHDIDGDFFDFIRLDYESMDLVVADVMGKGIKAAFLGAALKSNFLRVATEARLSFRGGAGGIEPEEIMDSVCSSMIDQLEELESFVTVFYARFNPKKRSLVYVDCGHVHPLHFRQGTGRAEFLRGGNMPLGFPEKGRFKQFSISFEPGDYFLFYSDGLTEAAGKNGELYGEDRLTKAFEALAGGSPADIINAVKAEITEFSGSAEFADDFTCIAVKADPEALEPELLGRQELLIDSRMEELSSLRRFIRTFCRKYMRRKSDESRIAGIELAAVEHTTNIIRHAYEGQAGKPIRLEAAAHRGEMRICLYDRGRPFEPGLASCPDLDGPREGGMGVYIIENSVDEISYSRNEQGENCAEMVVRWN